MCGLAGFVHLEGVPNLAEAPQQILTNMVNEIAARGPNGRGAWHDSTVVYLGHCRLSIIDLSDLSSQPMRLENDELVMVYNGEIYNYQRLREILVGLGESFYSAGDTEVVLRGFKRFGINWLKQLNGMFAAAVWDKRNDTLTLFRDRFGIKPIYWTVVGGTVLFASQIKSFLQYPLFQPKFNVAWLNEYLTFQNVHGSTTPFVGVNLLEPGQSLSFRRGSTTAQATKWAADRQYRPNDGISPDMAAREITYLFSKAVENTLVSDVPVGSYLSGGIDSGAVVTIARQFDPKLHTFTCGFDDAALGQTTGSINELTDARELASILRCNFHQSLIAPEDIPAIHRAVFKTVEEPRVGVFYQNDVAARLASKWVRVCLSGAGGDELFGGYPWRYKTICDVQDRDGFLRQYYGFWQRAFRDEAKTSLFTSKLQSELDFHQPFQRFASYFPEEGNYADLGFRLWLCLNYEGQSFLHGLLQIGDRMAGAYGLEERFPFLDNELVSYLDTVPAHYHWDAHEKPVNGQYQSGKRLLRLALSKLLPQIITSRRKQGFVIPAQDWFSGPLKDFVSNELCDRDTRLLEYIEPASIRRVIDGDVQPGSLYNSSQLWSLLSVEAMLKEFFTAGQPQDDARVIDFEPVSPSLPVAP